MDAHFSPHLHLQPKGGDGTQHSSPSHLPPLSSPAALHHSSPTLIRSIPTTSNINKLLMLLLIFLMLPSKKLLQAAFHRPVTFETIGIRKHDQGNDHDQDLGERGKEREREERRVRYVSLSQTRKERA
jgi:hypothetical protein